MMQSNTATTDTMVNITTLPLSDWIERFIIAGRAEGKRPRTITIYIKALGHFCDYCATRRITTIEAIDAGLIREYLLELRNAGHNPGGLRWHYQNIKAFLSWYELEDAPDGWRNPIRKVKKPRVPEKILDPIGLGTVARMIATCDETQMGKRDKAVLLTLLDTGARAGEALAFNVADLDIDTATLTIHESKTGKGRKVFLGEAALRAVLDYLEACNHKAGPLFITISPYNKPLTYKRLSFAGLRQMVRRKCKLLGIPEPGLHSFRRAFALNCLRAGMDLLSLQKIMGHASLDMLTWYTKLLTADLQEAHRRASPADRLGL